MGIDIKVKHFKVFVSRNDLHYYNRDDVDIVPFPITDWTDICHGQKGKHFLWIHVQSGLWRAEMFDRTKRGLVCGTEIARSKSLFGIICNATKQLMRWHLPDDHKHALD